MHVYAGRVMQTPTKDQLEVGDRVVVVDGGEITAVHDAGSEMAIAAMALADAVTQIPEGSVMMPGLVDLHIHAPQWPQLGTALDLPLEKWLFEHTFPCEARFADVEFARVIYADMVRSLLSHGTTTAVYYSSVHRPATVELAKSCVASGQRAFVGRVAMDHPEGTPEWYRDDNAAVALASSEASIEEVRAVAGSAGLVEPILTPRFAPACTDPLLAGMGELAATTGVRVQTHCSESDWEHGYAFDRFGLSDTEALDRFGLMREHTILAHADFVSPGDMTIIAAKGAAIAHCPLSNSYFGNAVFPARRALEAGVRVGLGTDIAGGARAGVLQQCHDAVTVSRMLEDGVDAAVAADLRGVNGSAIDTVTAFWMATGGGADALGLPVGLLAAGRRFDAVVVDIDRPGGAIRSWAGIDDDTRLFEKIVRLAGPDDISSVWVDGRKVVGN